MKTDRIILCLALLNFISKCAAYDWKKWQEELELSYPEQFTFDLELEKDSIIEGEPIIVSCHIVNHSSKIARIIFPPLNRKEALHYYTINFYVKEDTIAYIYAPYVHADIGIEPAQEKLLLPGDTMFLNGILYPDNFWSYKERKRVALLPNIYKLWARIHLGVKFYPRPARDLRIVSDSVKFSIKASSIKEKQELNTISPYLREFFGYCEETDIPDSSRNAAYPKLDKIRKTDSYLAPYAEFVYIGLLAFDKDREKLDKGIIEAQRFLKKHTSSILGEEMEFLLAKMFYRKAGISDEFKKQARHLLEKYPKNINCFEIKKLLEEK
ncbi:MAG: hypothetical protein ABIL70_06215 [candidate division WOR-3 bacterium]